LCLLKAACLPLGKSISFKIKTKNYRLFAGCYHPISLLFGGVVIWVKAETAYLYPLFGNLVKFI